VRLGDGVFIGPHVCFTNDRHPPSETWEITIVNDGASIGAGAVLLPGITLGKNCMIGAGSVVTRDVPEGETWVGNPAHKHGD
jgi:acetyltransferase-like isoleucine patch superfamily enzyme